jgi:hypothetical protein
VRINIASTQHALKEQHRSCPNRGAAAKPRQDELADHGLDLKQQKCTAKNGQRKQQKNTL